MSGFYLEMVRDTIADLAPQPGGWVSLRRLRAALPAVPRETMDAVLREIDRHYGVIAPEDNQKVLTDADRAAAIRIGGQDKHLVALTRAGNDQ
ncbi:hypothetical protein ACFQ68_13180 [Amycolatopsis japonica]|uniref:hypothetical protein n=1 Tax=Amycolatopsis japonica TaxID=208439 RepID=UPI00366EC0BA